MRYKGSINLGAEIIISEIRNRDRWVVDDVYFGEKIDYRKYDLIAFNIFYVTHQMNLIPFLRENNIPLKKIERNGKPLLIAGGQGIINPKPLSDYIDYFVMGDGENAIQDILYGIENKNTEFDNKSIWTENKEIVFDHIPVVKSEPIIRNGHVVIELTRGCRYRCKFCQYSHISGKYREKDFALVKEQLSFCSRRGYNHINFLSCNLCGYSHIIELLDLCIEKNISVANSDIRINDYFKVENQLEVLKIRTLKTGIETYNEDVRYATGKQISDDDIIAFINHSKHHVGNIHIYLIYGLPYETDYESWFSFLKKDKELIADISNPIRIEHNITNFEPSPYTPFENERYVNFEEKHVFLKRWLKELELNKYLPSAEGHWYHNMKGRLGRMPEQYALTMWLMHGDKSVGRILEMSNIKGTSRSIKLPMIAKLVSKGAVI
jgi:radical SAM superfamily enzyme YgiQ (UPF0313 family)